MAKITYIPGEIANAAIDEHGNRKPVTRTHHIFDDNKNKNQAEINIDIDNSLNHLSDKINAINKQDIIPVDALPDVATANPKKIYRVVGENSYTDYMLNASGDNWKKLATYNFPGIDDEPTAKSDNLVKSGGVANKFAELEFTTSEISKEVIETEEDSIDIYSNSDDVNPVFHLDNNGLDAKNVKSNGKDVLTEHQSLDGKQDKIDQITIDDDGREDDEYIKIIHNDKTFLKITSHGIFSDFLFDGKGNSINRNDIIVVGENEAYTTIQGAIDAAKHGQTIFIKDGEYKEVVIINKYVHLVGASKHGVILWNDDGHYENAPLMLTMGSVRNMTIYAKRDESKDYSFSERKCYAIHLDKNFSQNFGRCEIVNCNIVSDFDDAIGTGTNYSQVYDIHDCYIHTTDKALDGAMAMKCHLGPNQTGGTIILRNNVFYAEKTTGIPNTGWDLQFNTGGITTDAKIDLLMIGNSLRSFKNAASSNFVHNVNNWGNRVSEMNN